MRDEPDDVGLRWAEGCTFSSVRLHRRASVWLGFGAAWLGSMFFRMFLAPAWLIRRTQAGKTWVQDRYVYMYIYIYIYVCVCVCVYVYIYIYIYREKRRCIHVRMSTPHPNQTTQQQRPSYPDEGPEFGDCCGVIRTCAHTHRYIDIYNIYILYIYYIIYIMYI